MATLLTLSSSRHPLPSSSRQHNPSVPSPPVKRSPLPSNSPRTAPRSRSRQSHREPNYPEEPMKEAPVSPTPKKGVRRSRRGQQQKRDQDTTEVADDGQDQDQSADEEALFDLLGVPAAPPTEVKKSTPGILPICKADLTEDKPRTRSRTRKQEPTSQTTRAPEEHNPEGETKKKNRSKKGKGKDEGNASAKTPAPISNLTATRPAKTSKTPKSSAQPAKVASPFETSTLSRSLPTDSVFEAAQVNKSKGKKDESAVWDMPEQQAGNQALTWQQKLASGSTESPRRPHRSTPGNNERKSRSRPGSQATQPGLAAGSSPLVPRPNHNRRVSLDAVPHSTFDTNQPFHTGFNVHRAPQTPAKLPTSVAPGASLPLISGEFPRIGKAPFVGSSGTPASVKYAGPTFHNSPHAASLPKPDLEDF